MFYLLEYRDAMIILRGLLILIVVIILGVVVTEQQVSSLTQRHENTQLLSMSYDQSGVYSIGVLGLNGSINPVYTVGELIQNDNAIILKTNYYCFRIPIYIEFDCRKELMVLDLWARELVAEGFKWKQKINVYIRQFR